MLNLIENPNADHIRAIAAYIDAELIENTDASSLFVANDNAKGTIGSFHVFPGLSVWTYDITFFSDFKVALELTKESIYYFSYNLKGHFLHRFMEHDAHQEIEQNQGMIVISSPDDGVEIIFPENVKLEISIVIVNYDLLDITSNMNALNLKTSFRRLFDTADKKSAYRYVSGINPETARYAEIIIKNDRTDLVGCLLVEGAVMNVLASQISAHNILPAKEGNRCNLRPSELKKLAGLGDFILANLENKVTISDLEKHFGISPKKIQDGTRYLFGQTVSHYIITLRLGHAKELIRTTDYSISEVSYAVGISSLSYFSKKFQERFGIFPSDYQKSFKGKNPLFELCYSSIMNMPAARKDLKDIVGRARISNEANHITGCLAHSNGTIIQVLEGKKDNVQALFDKIKSDRRHNNVELLWKGAIPKRNFERWSMALVSDDTYLGRAKKNMSVKIKPEELLKQFEQSATVSGTMFKQMQKVIGSNIRAAANKMAG